MSSYVVELKKSYVDLFRALDSYGYLSVDMGVVLSGLRAGVCLFWPIKFISMLSSVARLG